MINASNLLNKNNPDNADDVGSIIFKINELGRIYTTAKNDAMNLYRQLEGMKVNVLFNTPPKQQEQLTQVLENESGSVAAEPQKKRGRGRPRKIKESIEMIYGDDMRDDQEVGNKMCGECRNYNSKSNTSLLDDEFNNAVYSIEDGELYVKTQFGKFYDINTMQLKGWFNFYLKKNVWVSYD